MSLRFFAKATELRSSRLAFKCPWQTHEPPQAFRNHLECQLKTNIDKDKSKMSQHSAQGAKNAVRKTVRGRGAYLLS